MEKTGQNITDFFPLAVPREKQLKALSFLQRRVESGYRNIIIEAPTGLGKSALGVAAGLWAASTSLKGDKGCYYLVTQKLLQDQLEHDFPRFVDVYKYEGASLKSSSEYKCAQYGDCNTGGRQKKDRKCAYRSSGACPYSLAYKKFVNRTVSVTNYPYFFTERTHVGRLAPRQVLVLDECHSIEKQILNFIEILIDKEALDNWAPHLRVPWISTLEGFLDWLCAEYVPVLRGRWELLLDETQESADRKLQAELQAIEAHLTSVTLAIESARNDPENWVYWQEQTGDGLMSVAKPLQAGLYTGSLLLDHADLKVFMSAYVGPKDVFCRNLGLDVEQTAFASLGSTFPVANRPIHLLFVGSMGRRSAEETTPALLRKIEKILTVHKEERGLIHVHSYKLGQIVTRFLRGTAHAQRVLFPGKASDRTKLLLEHVHGGKPTVLISPSITEGFSFDDDLARFQIIAKMPYASLGDRQVAAKKDQDNDWYILQTVSTFLQAAGRIVRSDTDHGVTYVLDSDFANLYSSHSHFFPPWLTAAFQWH